MGLIDLRLPIAVLLPLAMTGMCHMQGQPKLADTVGTAIDAEQPQVGDVTRDIRAVARFIIVGLVKENRVVVEHVEATRYPGLFLDLHLVTCVRENSIVGDLEDRELEFYYFADGRYPDSTRNPVHKASFQANPGSRYIFFLSREKGTLRSVGDAGSFTILVASGKHPAKPATGRDAGERIAEILLTLGEGSDVRLFRERLYAYSDLASIWASRLTAVRLLRRLLTTAGTLRWEACRVLNQDYYGQSDCLQAIAGDPATPVQQQQWALRTLEDMSEVNQLLLEDLRDPAKTRFMDFAGDSLRRLREEFQTLLFNPDPVLHERACGALRRYFPYEVEPKCSGDAVQQIEKAK